MLQHTIKIILGAMIMLPTLVQAQSGTAYSAGKCKTITPNASVTIQKVTKIGIATLDAAAGTNLMEISGTSNGQPATVRFKVAKANSPSASDLTRLDSSNQCIDNARIALTTNKPLQFVENTPYGEFCDTSEGKTNHRIFEVRDQKGNLVPSAACSIGSLPGVLTILFPDNADLINGN